MSTLIVELSTVKDIAEHPNADRLDIATVKGWQVIVGKDTFKTGDLVVFIPPDSILPAPLHELLGITKYCAELPKSFNTDARRVKAARLRGVPSYGTLMSMDTLLEYRPDLIVSLDEIDDLKDVLNITKWEPPIKATQGDVVKDHPEFHKYTDIENWRNFPNVFYESDVVMVTEKLHGTNCRLGFVKGDNYNEENPGYQFVAGSHNTRRKEPEEGENSLYWQPYTWHPQIKQMMYELWERYQKPIVLFGEIYGQGVQDLTYDRPGAKGFRAFDMSIGGEYVDQRKWSVFKKYKIPTVPVLYVGNYSVEKIEECTNGITTLNTDRDHVREGCVITSMSEDTNEFIGRRILKSVSVDYLERKDQKDGH